MMATTQYKKLDIVELPANFIKKNEAVKYWEKFNSPKCSKEFSTINHVNICSIKPYDYVVNSSTKLSLFDGQNNDIVKTFTNRTQHFYGGQFRQDGSMIACGTNDSSIVVFDTRKGHLLRELIGHQKDVRGCFFTNDKVHIISCADDSTCKLWDISVSTCITTFKGHQDYVRCGALFPNNPHIFVSGSYDHNVFMWDIRAKNNGKPQRSYTHDHPVECIKVSPNGNVFYTGSGSCVKLWDAIGSSRKEVDSFSNHIKTVTSVDFVCGNSCIITSSIDRTVKIHDIITHQVLQSSQYISPVMTLAKSRDDNRIVFGTSTGHLYVMNVDEKFAKNTLPKPPVVSASKVVSDQIKAGKNVKIVKKIKHVKYGKYEKLLRKFEYKATLEEIFIPGKYPEHITISVIQELIRQNSLKNAVANSSLATINLMIKFICDVVRSTSQMGTLITFADSVIDACEYGNIIVGSLNVDDKSYFEDNLARLYAVLEKELNSHTQAYQIIGMIKLIKQFDN